MNLRDLRLRARALFRPRTVERELQEELAFHIEREAQQNLQRGLPADEARMQAKARFGPAALAADECRDARGTAVVDAAVRDVLYAVRTFRRAPLAAITIGTTVALGLGLVAVVFTVFNVLVFRVDNARRPHELFEIERRLSDGERSSLTLPQFNALRRDGDAFSDTFAMLGDITSRIDGRMMEGTTAAGNASSARTRRLSGGR